MPERKIANNPEQMLREIEEQLTYNLEMIKQLQGTYRGIMNPDDEAQAAEAEIYPLWREYLKAYQERCGDAQENNDEEVQKTFADFGDLDGDFQDWWRDGGRELFVERGPLAVIDVEGLDRDWAGPDDYPKHITLKIPLTVPRDNILKQLNDVLDKCHMGTLLYRHQHSSADYSLYPRSKYIIENFKRMLRVWELTQEKREGKPENEKAPWWKIGQLAELSPAMDPEKGTKSHGKAEAQQHLTKLASDLYKKAEKVMHNAIRGEFPKTTIEPPNDREHPRR